MSQVEIRKSFSFRSHPLPSGGKRQLFRPVAGGGG